MTTLFTGIEHYFVVGLTVLAGQAVYAAVGFGAGLVTISLLTLLYGDVELYVPFFLLLCLPTEVTIAWRDRQHIELRRHAGLLLAILPALGLGAVLLDRVPGEPLEIALGVTISLLACYFLLFEARLRPRSFGAVSRTAAGLTSGLLGGLFGLAGPPLVLLFKTEGLAKRAFRAALLSIFLLMSLARLGVYGGLGLYTGEVVVSAAATLPFVLVGLLLGAWLHGRIPEQGFKRVTSLILLASGVLLTVKHVS